MLPEREVVCHQRILRDLEQVQGFRAQQGMPRWRNDATTPFLPWEHYELRERRHHIGRDAQRGLAAPDQFRGLDGAARFDAETYFRMSRHELSHDRGQRVMRLRVSGSYDKVTPCIVL